MTKELGIDFDTSPSGSGNVHKTFEYCCPTVMHIFFTIILCRICKVVYFSQMFPLLVKCFIELEVKFSFDPTSSEKTFNYSICQICTGRPICHEKNLRRIDNLQPFRKDFIIDHSQI